MATLALIVLASLTAARPAEGEVPTAADAAACNMEAPGAAKAGMIDPTTGDHARAESARGGANSPAPAGTVIESSNPQIHGMDAQGAKDPTYQAAYRSCMRRKGF